MILTMNNKKIPHGLIPIWVTNFMRSNKNEKKAKQTINRRISKLMNFIRKILNMINYPIYFIPKNRLAVDSTSEIIIYKKNGHFFFQNIIHLIFA